MKDAGGRQREEGREGKIRNGQLGGVEAKAVAPTVA